MTHFIIASPCDTMIQFRFQVRKQQDGPQESLSETAGAYSVQSKKLLALQNEQKFADISVSVSD